MKKTQSRPQLSVLLQQFFLNHLMQQKNVSPQTVASYRDTFRLLLNFAHKWLGKSPAKITLPDMDASLVLAFLNDIERNRHNSIHTRNTRLTAVRSFMHYVSTQDPISLPMIQSILAIPLKRFDQPLMDFFSREEINALLNAPDITTWCGRRDRIMFNILYNTGARVSEMIEMKVKDIVLGRSPAVRIHGKGRKERTVPIWSGTARQLREWMHQIDSSPNQHLFPNRAGGPLSRTGVTDRLKLALQMASQYCPQLQRRKISPHRIRHTTACHLLQSGVDLTVIALWLGHESPSTTHRYVEANLDMKQKALNMLKEPQQKVNRYRPTDSILAFLDNL
ncbi:tyrosine-type recombinase/integrase [Pseudomaricurvus alcaniphilus]|uniref:site-specific integrase n=1 Tax=Pseudomaricurvus alcaniphilus TaxID=1166482 RepID=UPI0014094ABD|nr:site-specific integrase [Pseudomaricurvus alcaniphilus]NHN39998.1 tyrosine-type recombinase/integrase [Pseudomaricurvus alcaniphilus]